MSPDEIIRRAIRYIIGSREEIPQQLIDEVRNRYPCPECANLPPQPPHPEFEYHNDVAEAAQELAQAVLDGEVEDRDQLHDRLWETIDGHQRIIYTGQAIETLRYSNNDAYTIENFGAEGLVEHGNIHWGRLAFGAFYADVMEHSDAPDWNTPFECSSCNVFYERLDDAQECCPASYECDVCEEEWDTPEEAADCCA